MGGYMKPNKRKNQAYRKFFHSAEELSKRTMERIEQAHMNKAAITGVPTGFIRFDELTGGLQKGDLIILAARPSQGKTAMAHNIVYHAAVKKNIPVVLFSPVMGSYTVSERMVCAAAKANLHDVRRGMFRRENWTSLTKALAEFAKAPLWIDDMPGPTVADIRSRVTQSFSDLKKQKKELGLIVIDCLQHITGAQTAGNRRQEIPEIASQLKDLAQAFNIPILLVVNLKPSDEDTAREGNKPQISDLRKSGLCEQDADVVALIWREEYYCRADPDLRNLATLIIAWQRNGPVGDVDLKFLHEYTRFENPAVPSK